MVVVVGGGFAGIKVAMTLDKHVNVILIDRKDFFFISFGALRAAVDPSVAPHLMVPYSKLLQFGHVVQGEVAEIGTKSLKLHGRDEQIPFDYLVITTGTSYAFPSKVSPAHAKDVLPLYEESAKEIEKVGVCLLLVCSFHLHLLLLHLHLHFIFTFIFTFITFPSSFIFTFIFPTFSSYLSFLLPLRSHVYFFLPFQAQDILIVGGGSVGIELLGEIAYKYPQGKNITLVHSHDHLIPGELSDRFKNEALKRVRATPNVNVILSDRVVFDDEMQVKGSTRLVAGRRTVKTEKGVLIEADIVFYCGSAKVNSNAFATTFASQMDADGRLKVNQYLQVEGYENIFAAGDCANVKESKLGYLAGIQGVFVGNNILLHVNGKDLKEHTPSPPGMFLTIGP